MFEPETKVLLANVFLMVAAYMRTCATLSNLKVVNEKFISY